MRFFAMLIFPVLLSSGTDVAANEHDARQALVELNSYIEQVQFSDACFERSDIVAIAPLVERIEAARARVAAKYNQLALNLSAGDSDYVCHRTEVQPEVNRQTIRKEALRLVNKLEMEADR